MRCNKFGLAASILATFVIGVGVLILGAASVASAEAIVHESFDYATGDLNSNTDDSGLGTWSAGAIYEITSPGMTYQDANGNDLAVAGNMLTQQWGKNKTLLPRS